VAADAAFQFAQFLREFLVRGQLLAHQNKRAHHADAGFNGDRAVQNAGEASTRMFGESNRQIPQATV